MLRIYISVTIAGVLSVERTYQGVTVTEKLNSGVALVPDAGYLFNLPVVAGETIDLVLSTPVVGSTCADGTGTCNGSPVTLALGANTITVTAAGTFTVTLGPDITGTATSGTATVAGSPQALVAGANVVDTGVTVGTFTITLSGGWINKLQIDESWS
jgi:hypothetical protein